MKKIIITGNVGRDPEVRADASGNTFVTFSVGVSVGTKQNPKTDWVDVVVSGRSVDVARNYVRKGSKVLVEGHPTAGAYINRENKPVGVLRIYSHNIEFLSTKREDEANTHHPEDFSEPVYNLPEAHHNRDEVEHIKEDEIPF
jgi:single-strand DNA-binding protein